MPTAMPVRLAAALAALTLTAAARAATLYDNTTTSVLGSDAVTSTNWIASSFTTGTATTSLTASLLLKQIAAGANTLTLYSNTAGGITPNAAIATLTSVSAPGTLANSLATWTSSSLSLTAGTKYWLVLSSAGSVAWNYSADSSLTSAWANYNVPSNTYYATGNSYPYIFSVTDTATTTGTAVSLTASDAVGTSSFASGLHWSDSAAPASTNAYAVGSGLTLRTPDGDNSATFGGGSLTVGNNGAAAGNLVLNNAIYATVTVNNLTLNKGMIINGRASSLVTVAGNGVTLAAGGGTLDSGSRDGTLIVNSVIGGTGPLTVVGGGMVVLTAANTYTGLTTVTSGTLRSQSGTSTTPLLNATSGVDLAKGGRLELVYDGVSPVAAVKSILASGYGLAAKFSSGQLRSSTLASGQTLGYRDNGSAVTVRVTLPGDADLDGDVDFADFVALQSSFGSTGTGFDQGNFDYDNDTDFADFVALQSSFGSSLAGAAAAFTAEQSAAVTAFGLANAVPEPAVAALALAGVGLLRRRR